MGRHSELLTERKHLQYLTMETAVQDFFRKHELIYLFCSLI